MTILTKTLTDLGVNQTVWIQLGFFLISYLFLSQFLFRPYKANLEFRKKNTGGSVEEATKLNSEADRLAMDYQGQMKRQNEAASAAYDQIKNEGLAEEEKLLAAARAAASKLLEETKKKVSLEVLEAKESLRAQIPQIGRLIASRVLGRDLS